MVKGVAMEGEGGDAKIGMEGKGSIKGLIGGIGGGKQVGRRGGGGRRDLQQGRVGGRGSHYGGRGLIGGLGEGGQQRGERDKEEGDEGEGEVASEEGMEVKKVAMKGEGGVAKVSMDGWVALRASLVGLDEEEKEEKGVRRKGRSGHRQERAEVDGVAIEWEGLWAYLEDEDEEEKGMMRKGRGKDGLSMRRDGDGGSHHKDRGLMGRLGGRGG